MPQTVCIDLDDIVLDDRLVVREKPVDLTTAQEYADAMERGETLPPARVFCIRGINYLTQGRHRYTARGILRKKFPEERKWKHLNCEIADGGWEEAVIDAVGSNESHGRRRTVADRRVAVEKCLTEFPDWTDHRIAEACKVSDKMVKDAREDLESRNKIEVTDERTSKDGRTFKTKSKSKAEKPDDPKPDPEPAPLSKSKVVDDVSPFGEPEQQVEASPDDPPPDERFMPNWPAVREQNRVLTSICNRLVAVRSDLKSQFGSDPNGKYAAGIKYTNFVEVLDDSIETCQLNILGHVCPVCCGTAKNCRSCGDIGHVSDHMYESLKAKWKTNRAKLARLVAEANEGK